MFSYVAVVLAALAIANASVIGVPSARILQGPSSRTTIVGPEGSVISSVAPGGRIITDETVGVVAQTVPALAAAPAIVAARSPIVAHGLIGAGLVAAPSVLARSGIVAAPGLIGAGALGLADTVVAGPSGTIATRGALGVPGWAGVSPLAVGW